MKYLIIVLTSLILLSAPVFGFDDHGTNLREASVVETVIKGETLQLTTEGTGYLYVNTPVGSTPFILTAAHAGEMIRYISRFNKFVDEVAKGNDLKYAGFLGNRAVMPFYPRNTKIFLYATTKGGKDNTFLTLRVVNFDRGGWGNDRDVVLTPEQANLLADGLEKVMELDRELNSKYLRLQSIVLDPIN